MATQFTIYGTRGTHTQKLWQGTPTPAQMLALFLCRKQRESERERKGGITVFWVGKWKWQYEGSGLQNFALLCTERNGYIDMLR